MKRTILLGFCILFFTCSYQKEKIKIEHFVWIKLNLNQIYNPADLQAFRYLDFYDSCSTIKLAITNTRLNISDFYAFKAPDSLRNLIISNLYSKRFPNCFEDNHNSIHIDGYEYYCIVFKFKDQVEQIFNYNTYTIPDSLKYLTDYLEHLTDSQFLTIRTNTFDRTSLINKYRDSIIKCAPLLPPDTPSYVKIKYLPPVIIDKIN